MVENVTKPPFAYIKEFLIGGAATTTAGVISNPFDVAKTRFQLQGELQGKGSYDVKYKNLLDAFMKIARYEGIMGIQKGLCSALLYQMVMNSTRLGTYQTIINSGFPNNEKNQPVFWKLALAGAFSGSVGALISSPLYLAKVQIQASAASNIAVGYQHQHTSVLGALKSAYNSPGGLFQGVTSALWRVSIGSATQLATFTRVKHFIAESKVFKSDFSVVATSSMVSSGAIVCTMTPFDVIATRMYNQKHGLFYTGWWDCVKKIFRTEGVYGFYKGTVAHYFRIGPHTILTLIIWDRYRKWFL